MSATNAKILACILMLGGAAGCTGDKSPEREPAPSATPESEAAPGEAAAPAAGGDVKVGKGVDLATKTIKIGALNDESGPAAAIGKPLVTLHDAELDHALKEIDAAACATARDPDQVVKILQYVTAKL